MWEAKRYDWTHLRAMGSALRVPDAIERMRTASSIAESSAAYWQIDNVVVVQGSLYEAALPTTACLVSALPSCSIVSRPHFLELLFQLGNGTPDPSEVALGNEQIAESCRFELVRDYGVYVNILEDSVNSDRQTEVHHCLDLLLLCVFADRSLKERVCWYYEKALRAGKGARGLSELIHSGLEELSNI
ncbi:MAG: hypothetical protein JWM87_1167 [Candidatus Eremiobacteraeota bacterium]|nr:hypothetical protein [Candidatus Eremiobacteraeota bacterium]